MKIVETEKDFSLLRSWADEDKPREKMISRGQSALTDTELLAILVNSGTPNEDVMTITKRILDSVHNDLTALSRLNVKDLMKFRGIGEAKAVAIASALELGRRRRESESGRRPLISTSKQAYEYLAPTLADLPHEEFWVLLLNQANKVLLKYRVGTGGLTGTVADQRIIFKKALEEGACGLILAHNHPSGNRKPSQSDIQLTQRMKEAGRIMDIPILDHLIITDTGYYSFADEEMM